MSHRVSMRDLARGVGVSVGTVSKALHGQAGVGPATRARILALAEELGYRPDPALSALATHREESRRHPRRSSIAVFWNQQEGRPVQRLPMYQHWLEGMVAEADQLGYQLHQEQGAVLAEDTLIGFRDRGVRGLILLGMRDWERHHRLIATPDLAVLAAGPPPSGVMVDWVSTDDASGVQRLCTELHRRGYRRPGLVLHPHTDLSSRGAWSTGFLAAQRQHFADETPIPICTEQYDTATVARWLRHWRPDALIARKPLAGRLQAAIDQAGRRVPEDLGYACLTVKSSEDEHSGVRYDFPELGRRCIRQLDLKLRHHHLGPADWPMVMLMGGHWHEGRTLPPRSTSSGR